MDFVYSAPIGSQFFSDTIFEPLLALYSISGALVIPKMLLSFLHLKRIQSY